MFESNGRHYGGGSLDKSDGVKSDASISGVKFIDLSYEFLGFDVFFIDFCDF